MKIEYIEQGKTISCNDKEPENVLEISKKAIVELLTVKNVHFLLGAGTSQPTIPDMYTMQNCFEKQLEANKEKKGIKLKSQNKAKMYYALKSGKKENLEKILGMLYAARHVESLIGCTKGVTVKGLIKDIKEFLFEKIVKANKPGDTFNIYKDFYRKVAFRNKDVARINVFTTNYDLFSEQALDSLKIDYNNGFGGGLKRYFNPARFHYTSSRKMDASIEKFEPIESMVYLYKLHGSVSWVESGEDDPLLGIEEKWPLSRQEQDHENNPVLIYPSPLKSGDTLASPYSDLMREFKVKLLLPHSALFVIGFSFSDDHINNIITQVLTVNPSLSIFVFGKIPPELCKAISKDQRFYQLRGEEKNKTDNGNSKEQTVCLHYFESIVKKMLPDIFEDEDKKLIDGISKKLIELRNL